ncbi:E3 ubiquitin-protein ligase SGR9, amyloplastic-like [Cannabis sativa]|nr:E3 ubiquitin-protein ligase SGR9, amyloplastic-like [Cannabis sativa]
MLSDTHLHTSVYHVTYKIVEYALRMWNDDYCNFFVRVDINVFVYVLPKHNISDPDSDSDDGLEDVAIEFVASSEDSIEKLEKFVNNNEIFLCTICCENVDDAKEVTQLPCKHPYHSECILKWL